MISYVHEWSAKGACFGRDTKDFFENYEDSVSSDRILADEIDRLCTSCSQQRNCLAFAVSHKEWGVWGGVFFEDGKISKANNAHKDNDKWHAVWMNATMG